MKRAPRRTIDRVAGRPKPSDWGDDDHLTLNEAIRVFWPEGPLTAASLRTEIARGRLQAEKIAGKMMVTPGYLHALRTRAREDTASMAERGRVARLESAPQATAQKPNDPSPAQLRLKALIAEQRARFENHK